MPKKTVTELVGSFGERVADGWFFSNEGLEKFVDSLTSVKKTTNVMGLVDLILNVANSDADLHIIYYNTDFEAQSLEKCFMSPFTSFTKFNPVIRRVEWTTPPVAFVAELNALIDRRCNILMLPFVYLAMKWRIAPYDHRTLIQNYFTFDPTPEQAEEAFQHVHVFANGLPHVRLGDV